MMLIEVSAKLQILVYCERVNIELSVLPCFGNSLQVLARAKYKKGKIKQIMIDIRYALRLTAAALLMVGLFACQPERPMQSKGWSDWFSSSENPPVTRRRCFTGADQGGTERVFLLALGSNVGKLKETHKDVRRFSAAMQKRFAIPAGHQCLLENVYRAEFEAALQALRRKVRSGDMVIVYYSGHGSFVSDKEGEEADGEDEIFVTYDAQFQKHPGRKHSLTDDRFVALVNALGTERVLTVIDACYSGGLYLDREPREKLRTARVKFFARGELGRGARNGRTAAPAGHLDTLNGVLLSAAREEEKAVEIPGRGGLFTEEFLRALALTPRQSLRQIFARAALHVQAERTPEPQHPQAIGDWSLFNEPGLE